MIFASSFIFVASFSECFADPGTGPKYNAAYWACFGKEYKGNSNCKGGSDEANNLLSQDLFHAMAIEYTSRYRKDSVENTSDGMVIKRNVNGYLLDNRTFNLDCTLLFEENATFKPRHSYKCTLAISGPDLIPRPQGPSASSTAGRPVIPEGKQPDLRPKEQ
jgi:hypothetical protein